MLDAPGSASATVVLPGVPAAGAPAAGAPAAGAPAAGAPAVFTVPKEYADRPYLKGVDSETKLYEMLDGAQELLGKRPAGIPAVDAPQDEWEKFYAATRPKEAKEYAFDIDPNIKIDPKIVDKTKEIMFKHGLTATQAKGVQKDFDEMAKEFAKANGIQLEQQNTDFDKLATKLFGNDRNTVLARGKELIATFAPPELKGEIAKLSNENLIVLAGVLNGIHAKYIKADGAPNTPPGGGPGGDTPETLRAEARALMASEAYTNPMHAEHENVKKKIDALYRRASGQQ
jgi:hypothetical protein